MLQQTRVEAMLDHYQRFMMLFPSVEALAAASQDEVLTAWQGLGYYSRARRLHQAAQILVAEHDGVIPDAKDTLRSLPGIGDYTCGAILSMAFGQPEIALDGNLLRIGARLFLIQDPINRMKTRRLIQASFENLVPPKRAGDFNQALMDLGSRACLPKNPRCQECPISHHCQAFLHDVASTIPIKNAPKPPQPVQIKVCLVKSQGAVLIRKREFGGFLQGMWELPWSEIPSQNTGNSLQVAEEPNWFLSQLGPYDPEEVYAMEYVFSHRHWFMTIFCYEVPDPFYTPEERDTLYLWQPLASIDAIALPTVFKRALKLRP
jgi:A/G-specific adenine glycosylase